MAQGDLMKTMKSSLHKARQGKARQIFLTSLGKMNLGAGIMLGIRRPDDNKEIIITQGKARQGKARQGKYF
jgi:hypothetical protein